MLSLSLSLSLSLFSLVCVFFLQYPDRYSDIIPPLTRVLRSIDEPEGKQSCIWMVGEYGETIDSAPYILESLIDSWEDETDNLVKMELLTATMKLFFKRPPEMKNMLAKLLKQAINTSSSSSSSAAAAASSPVPLTPSHSHHHHPHGGAQPAKQIVHIDVRDRALLYYRLLQFDVHEAARVVNSAKKSVASAAADASLDGGRSLLFAEQVDVELMNKIFHEFNSLSVIYSTPQERFLKAPVYDEEEEKKREAEEQAKAEAESASASLTGGAASTEGATADAEDILPANMLGASAAASTPSHASAAPAPAREVDLLGDFMSSLEVSSPLASPPSSAPSLQLLSGQTLDKATYQGKWSSLPAAGQLELSIRSRPITPPLVEQLLASSANIITFASGAVGNNIKFFLFGRDVSAPAALSVRASPALRCHRCAIASDLPPCAFLLVSPCFSLPQSSSLYLMEMNVDTQSGRLVATLKTDSAQAQTNIPLLQTLITKALQPIC